MLRSCLVSAAAAVAFSLGANAQTVPTGFVIDTLVSSGLAGPNDFCFLPDGRVLIANRAGSISIYAGGPVASIGSVASVDTGLNEQGLLSIQADPSFNTNGYIYVWYNTTFDSVLHLERFTCTGVLNNPGSTALTLDAASRRIVMMTTPDNAYNHNGGSIRFGPDGMLYLTMGDDATGGCPAQLTTTSLGCLMRMNVSVLPPGGSLTAPTATTLDPGNNPLSANTDLSQLVIAHGLRNPFRMEIDPITGSVYIGDVGEGSQEEYSEYAYPSSGPLPLVNFGWPWREGSVAGPGCTGTQPSGLTAPLASVAHNQGWFSVMGGARYRNRGAPWDFGSAYEGSAFYLDYFSGELRRLVNTGNWVVAPAVPGQPTATDWGVGFDGTTSLRLGPDGCLWFTDQGTDALKRVRAVAVGAVTYADACYAPFNVQVAGNGVVGGSLVSSVTQVMPWIVTYGLNRQPVSLSLVWPACQCVIGHDLVVLELQSPGASDSLTIAPAWGAAGYSILIQGIGLQHPTGGPCPDLQIVTTDTVQITTR